MLKAEQSKLSQKLLSNQITKNIVRKKRNQNRALEVEIKTPRLTLKSLNILGKEQAYKIYRQLFGHEQTMEKFGFGHYYSDEHFKRLQRRVDRWCDGWENGRISAFAIFCKDLKTNVKKFIGHVVADDELVAEDKKGKMLNIAILIHKDHQHIGFGTEAFSAMVNHFIPDFIAKYNPNFTDIEATVRVDNESSKKLLKKFFMQEITMIRQYDKNSGAVTDLYNDKRLVVEAKITDLICNEKQKYR